MPSRRLVGTKRKLFYWIELSKDFNHVASFVWEDWAIGLDLPISRQTIIDTFPPLFANLLLDPSISIADIHPKFVADRVRLLCTPVMGIDMTTFAKWYTKFHSTIECNITKQRNGAEAFLICYKTKLEYLHDRVAPYAGQVILEERDPRCTMLYVRYMFEQRCLELARELENALRIWDAEFISLKDMLPLQTLLLCWLPATLCSIMTHYLVVVLE